MHWVSSFTELLFGEWAVIVDDYRPICVWLSVTRDLSYSLSACGEVAPAAT